MDLGKYDVPLVEFMYLVIKCTPGESYRRRIRPLLYLCYVFQALILTLYIHYFTSPPLPQQNCPLWNLTNLFLQANYALICLSFFCIFIHSMFMTYEILSVPMPHVLRCPMYICMYVCNKDALKNVKINK